MPKETVAVIGHLGDWGKKASEMMKNAGYDVVGSDIKDPNSPTAKDAINATNNIYFSLPTREVPKLINNIGPSVFFVKKLIDNTGDKDPLIPTYRILDANGTSICSTHPNCIPTQDLENQTIMIMPVGKNWQPATEIALDIYQNAGMIPVDVKLEDHDKYMDINQFLYHVANRSVAATIAHFVTVYDLDMDLLEKLATANAQLSELAVWRTLIQKPELSAQIISHDKGNTRRENIASFLSSKIVEYEMESEDPLVNSIKKVVEELDPTGKKKERMLAQTSQILKNLADQKTNNQ